MEGCSWFRVIQPFGNSYGIRVHLNERHGMTDFIVGNGLVPFRRYKLSSKICITVSRTDKQVNRRERSCAVPWQYRNPCGV